MLKILISYHKNAPKIKSDAFVPIHVGKASANENIKKELSDMIGDDTGDNISKKNPNYCELTAQYWACKNYDKLGNPDYIGFMHYRRLLNLGKENINEILEFDDKIIDNIDYILKEYDIVLPPVFNTHPVGLPHMITNNYDFYCRDHYKEDLDKLINIIKEYYPSFAEALNEYLRDTRSFFFNMFIMKKEMFLEYSKWLFDILFKVEKVIDTDRDFYQNRALAFLGERLLNIFIINYTRTHNNIKIKHANIVNVCEIVEPMNINKAVLGNDSLYNVNKKVNKDNSINIAYASDDNYARHLCASIASVLLNSQDDSYYNFIILDGGISDRNKNKIKNLNYIKNFNIKFYDMKDYNFSDFKLNRAHISEATYYRLILFDLLDKDTEKIIYLDCDTIIEKDLKYLWEIDIEEYCALVVEDECGITQSKRLGLPIVNKYFNAGVLAFNAKKIREFDFYNKCLEIYKNNESLIYLQDQDILNIALNNKCKFVPINWNCNTRIYLGNNLHGLNTPYYEQSYTKEEADNAKYNPYILHYTDESKPWDIFCKHPLKNEYFRYLRFTQFRFYRLIYFINKHIFYYRNRKDYIKIKILFINITIKL